MIKQLAAFIAATVFAVASFAAVDANKGSVAELDGIKTVGPALSKRIVDARGQGEFKDWTDLMNRVKGIKSKAAAKLSAEGLTVNGQGYKGEQVASGSAAGKMARSETRPGAKH